MSRVVTLCSVGALAWPQLVAAQATQDVGAKVVNIDQCRPTYPAESVTAQEEGITRLRAHVTAAGELRGLSLVRSSGHDRLDQATLRAIGTCRFSPGMRAGVAADSSTVIEFKWRLEPAQARHTGCRPEYPPESIRAEEQGTTELRFRVAADGKPQDVEVSKSSGHARLDTASMAALNTCKFRVDGTTPAGPMTVKFVWKMEDAQPVAPAVNFGPTAPDPYLPKL